MKNGNTDRERHIEINFNHNGIDGPPFVATDTWNYEYKQLCAFTRLQMIWYIAIVLFFLVRLLALGGAPFKFRSVQ